MKHKKLVLVISLVMVLGFAGISPAAKVFNDSVPIAFYFFDPCTDECVSVQGDVHVLLNITTNAKSCHVKFHANFQGVDGVGCTNEKYTGMGVANATLNLNNKAANFSIAAKFKLNAKGAADNLEIDGKFHITIDAQGEVKSIFFEPLFPVECKG
ncbi:MAG: hypothetical protein QME75_14945 [Deltaproteobacteria bacterium]|nr:hypothetical protein [Deltaproteobacteria bacterium]